MRVSDATFYLRFLVGLGSSQQTVERTLRDLADGKRVRVVSDDPTGAPASLRLRARVVALDGYARSATSARADLATIDNALGEVVNILASARAEAMGGASVTSQGGNQARATRLDGLREELLGLANTNQNGRFLFAGTETLTLPFDATGAYFGDDAEAQAPIDTSEAVGGTVSGRRAFLTGGDLFQRLAVLSQDLRTGNTAGIEAAVTALRDDITRVADLHAEIGTRLQRIDTAMARHGDEEVLLRQRIGEIEDADLAAVTLELQSATTSRTALSQTAARVLGRSLFDYLG
ncbi:MAG TPA: hypothetical protein VFT43_12665 [Candidatus Polarisedimenticolia bacterium]|nr:hypothetical protein [Candidatus Polarisedimenticolia bacterium]